MKVAKLRLKSIYYVVVKFRNIDKKETTYYSNSSNSSSC